MKRKALIIAVFLVTGLVFSNFLAISSLSLTKQIKSTFSEEKNLGQEIGRPTGQEGRTLSFERGNFKWGEPMFKVEPFSYINTIPGNSLKVAAKYSSFLILLLIIIFVIRKHYKNKKMRKNNRIHKIEEVQKQPAVLENKDIIDTVSSTKEKRIATIVQIHETRRLLKEWEARLENNRMKRDAETINEWFERINGPKEIIPIYERVRYGEKSCTKDELLFIKETLKL